MKDNLNDKVYTPDHIVDEVLKEFLPLMGYCGSETILEPFKGGGAFLDKLPVGTLWCEIDDGINFLDFTGKVDWIITNPPYSCFDIMLGKMLSVADNIIVVIPVNKILSSMPRLMDINNANSSIKHIHYLGSGRQIGFPFGFPVAAVYITKGFHPTTITYSERCKQAKRKMLK
ncbi:hypothetical protein S140_144 [Shewanella sp. phage 1/40]|uniref:DNA methyltransferase n=1 Tax=Shewanella sp. phage 1/40 TaxID=1458860 RepID=UPI0004F90586|nr:DNA methyltransferase [Shewanella sp. phage 1/40]AHK11551.1 hypothetical protein S140_144 [Shewanella sp. phage 1/40]